MGVSLVYTQEDSVVQGNRLAKEEGPVKGVFFNEERRNADVTFCP